MNMQNALDPDHMTVEQRGREVASFLALGLLRLRTPAPPDPDAERSVSLGFRSPQRVHTPPLTA